MTFDEFFLNSMKIYGYILFVSGSLFCLMFGCRNEIIKFISCVLYLIFTVVAIIILIEGLILLPFYFLGW